MPKLGDIRDDGMVFAGSNRSFKSGEYWTTREMFLKQRGADWFERRARMDENVGARAARKAEVESMKAQRAAAKRERLAAKALARKGAPRRVFHSEEERRLGMIEWERARRQTDHYKARRKRMEDRLKAEAAARREVRRKGREERDAALALEKATKLAERKARGDERRRLKELRAGTRRKSLTDAERLESKRAEKRNYKHRRRCLLRGQESKATPKQVAELKKLAKGRCFYCRVKTARLTLDHVIPIAKGGCHTLDNIVFACHACNSEKRDLDPEVYAEKHGLLLI